MKKFSVIAVILTVVIMIGGVFLLSRGQNSKSSSNYPLPANLMFYWGNGCSHCKIVEDFISTWGKKDTIKMDRKEVWGNAANAREMQARYEYCKVPPSEMGVPLLFTPDGKCFSGDTPVIDYLKSL